VDWLRQRSAWLVALDARLRRSLTERAAAAERVEAARARLVEAHREQEVLEQLRRRQEGEWLQEQARRERKFLDEIAAVRAARGERSDLA
jgi:flagellar export protein FliJ